jgi:hypothetical protein
MKASMTRELMRAAASAASSATIRSPIVAAADLGGGVAGFRFSLPSEKLNVPASAPSGTTFRPIHIRPRVLSTRPRIASAGRSSLGSVWL